VVQDITKEEKEKFLNVINELTNHGKGVLGFASKEVDKNKNSLEITDSESGLSWVGR
jgi:predicted secreted protein